ncbi:hypothetical protein ACQ4PT_071686 [Festuca glaucescens]
MPPGAAPPAVRCHRRNLDHQGAPPPAEESPRASLPSARVREGRRRLHRAGFAWRPAPTAVEEGGGELGGGCGNGRGGGRGGARGGRGRGRGNQNRPARGRDNDNSADEECGDEEEGEHGFQEPHGDACIHGGAYSLTSHGEVKQLSWEVYGYSREGVGILPLVVAPVINNMTVSKMLVDGGVSLNLISTRVMENLQITEEQLSPTGPFHSVNPGTTQPLGKIMLSVTFGTRENYDTKNITFDVADISLPYNSLIRRPALAKFMVVTHHVYNTLKMPATRGLLTVKDDAKDHVFCMEQIFKITAAAVPGNIAADEPGTSDPTPPMKKARVTLEPLLGAALARPPSPASSNSTESTS